MIDIFDRIANTQGPLEQYQGKGDGYFLFPQLEGPIGPEMVFNGKKVLNWSLNNYLGLAGDPDVIRVDAEAAKQWGMAAPMGARMMSGDTKWHHQLQDELAAFVSKPAAYLLNFGYQGMISIIDVLCSRFDVIVYDYECHACIMDGIFLHKAKGGKSFAFPHNDIENCEKKLVMAEKYIEREGGKGGILVITEGVYGMTACTGRIDLICELKKRHNFRLLIDDAHGFGTMGKTGAGTGEYYGVQDQVDIYFSTFAKSMAGIGAFVASTKDVVDHLRFNMRSQIYAKSLPMPMTIGALYRLHLLRDVPTYRERLWTIVNRLQDGLKAEGFNIGNSNTPVTPIIFKGDIGQGTNVVVDLRENYGIFCSIVVYPVVPRGIIMLRVIPTAAHTIEHVDRTIAVFKEVKQKLESGYYNKPIPQMALIK